MFGTSTQGTNHSSHSSMSQPCHHQKVIHQSISSLPSCHVAFFMPCLLNHLSSYYMCIGGGRYPQLFLRQPCINPSSYLFKNKGMNIKINITFVTVFHHGIFQFASTSCIHIDTSPKFIYCQGSLSFSDSIRVFISFMEISQSNILGLSNVDFFYHGYILHDIFLFSHVTFPGAFNQSSSIVVKHLYLFQ